MSLPTAPTIAIVLTMFTGCFAVADESRPDKDVDQAVRQAIPYLQREGASWISERGCVSCHQVPFMIWSLSAAERHGFEVDADDLRKTRQWAETPESFVGSDQRDGLDVAKTLASNIDTMNALLLANEIDDAGSGDDWQATFADALVQNQKGDGSWRACGQLPMQKRPKPETTQVTTLWTLLALARQQVDSLDLKSAITFAENEKPASTEWWVARLLLADETAESCVAILRRQLIDRQHADGGWGWLSDDPSDALATGMALYALKKSAGSADDDQRIEAATAFLTSTQQPGGEWLVPGTKNKTRNKTTETANYWGTAWAVIGMLE